MESATKETESSLIPSFEEVRRREIKDQGGISYEVFRRTLTPKYRQVWIELLAGHAALIGLFTLFIFIEANYLQWWPLQMLLGAAAVGYVYAYIQLFFHEAAHYNIYPSRPLNDLLANTFIGPLTGLDIAQYRKIHFDHHRHLGSTKDPERAYFRPMNLRFFVEGLLGIQVINLLRARSLDHTIPQFDFSTGRGRLQFLLGILFNGFIVISLFLLNYPLSALTWALGVLAFFPFFTAFRQVLEHRDEMADPLVDYSLTPHGEINRLFGDGPVASTLGAAGFNRHFLHHWDPQLSYTRLRDVENYLVNTALSGALSERRTTYVDTFLKLFDPRWY